VTGFAGIVLAAGASTRMGGPKPLVAWRGRTFLEHAIDLGRAAGCTDVVVVTGAHPLPEIPPARQFRCIDWEAGQIASLRAGIRAVLPDDPAGILVLTVDRPHVRHDTVAALAAAFAREPDGVWQPAHGGAHGHPIVWPADLARTLANDAKIVSARDVLDAAADRRRFLDVDDPAVLDNIDRPEDLARLG
jgi:CTP:molybdopterin cytidylyltransferase MocA